LVSFGVVISGIIISETHIKWIDPLISLLIMAVVIYSTWGLLIESLNLSLDAVPVSIDLEKTKNEILKNKEVLSVHDIHIWAMSTTKNALIAHLIIDKDLNEEQIIKLKEHLRHELEHLNIHHTTFETELSDCKIKEC
jgi:cobalt-zinc-cadmium efflux system protein